MLVPNPVSAVKVSPAYLFRKVGSDEGVTILFDEIDTVFGPKAKENEEIRGLLNAGHRRGAVVGRCIMNGKTVMTEEISAYAPVALAGLGWLPDTILSRSVIVRMRRRHQGEVVEQFRRRIHVADGERVRNTIEAWARTLTGDITWPEMPAGVQDRDADVWEPLIAIADVVGGKWPEVARDAALALLSESKDTEPSLGIRLLADLRTIFGEEKAISTASILRALHDMDEAPWGDIRGKPLNERGLANRLRQYGVRSKTVRTKDGTPKGYAREDLYDQCQRYLPPPGPAKSATSETSTTSQANQPQSVADRVADVLPLPQQKKPSNTTDVADVADVADLSGSGGGESAKPLRTCAQCGGPWSRIEATANSCGCTLSAFGSGRPPTTT